MLMLFMHSVTPHCHITSFFENTQFGASSDCSHGLFDDLFKYDLGESHLEEFEGTRALSDDCQFTLFIIDQIDFEPLVALELPRTPLYPLYPSIEEQVSQRFDGLRAPPVQMI